ncbi:MAG TPA: aldehyde dehydrogenase family protein, partial [Chthoniobacterales bacterium]|nr:aldehyde dehydrogenase family protein [Chthoniobacterales bacterium]
MAIASINPATGETVKEFAAMDSPQIEDKLRKADDAFRSYRKTSFEQRANWLSGAADLLETDKPNLARIMTLEMGKLLRAAEEEVTKCARGCRFYAENAERFLAEQKIETESAHNFVRYEPMGPVLAIMPWNFPFWQVFRFAAPALMAGNVALLKHAANVPQCALAIENIFRRAEFPDGVFQTLLVENEQVRPIIEDSRVRAVTLTGSERAGSE